MHPRLAYFNRTEKKRLSRCPEARTCDLIYEKHRNRLYQTRLLSQDKNKKNITWIEEVVKEKKKKRHGVLKKENVFARAVLFRPKQSPSMPGGRHAAGKSTSGSRRHRMEILSIILENAIEEKGIVARSPGNEVPGQLRACLI